MKLNRTAAVVIGAAVLVSGSIGAASADDIAKMITSKDIKDGTIQVKDLTDGAAKKLAGKDGKDGAAGADGAKGATGAAGAAGAKGDTGPAGAPGAKGDAGAAGADGTDGLLGAVYRTLTYTNGGGGSATVACADTEVESMKYTAISGGVQGSTNANQSANSFAVTSSFPGRMNWDAGVPKADRLDGWIIFGNGQYTSTLTVWALCVPNTSIEVDAGTLDN